MGENQKFAIKATAQASEDSDNKRRTAPKVPDQFADESFKLFSKIQVTDPTPEEARRIRNKCLWRILPFLCIGYHLMYVDKQTVRVIRYTMSYVRKVSYNISTAWKFRHSRNYDRRPSQLKSIQLAFVYFLLRLSAS
jgi:hypothetical protein